MTGAAILDDEDARFLAGRTRAARKLGSRLSLEDGESSIGKSVLRPERQRGRFLPPAPWRFGLKTSNHRALRCFGARRDGRVQSDVKPFAHWLSNSSRLVWLAR